MWGSISALHLWTCPWVDCFSLDVGFMSKSLYIFCVLWGFLCLCVLIVCVRLTCPSFESPSVRNKSEHSVAQHEQRSFYMSLRSVKAESRWFLKISWLADLLVAPRHYGQLSTTETTPEPGCASPCGSGSIVLSMSRALCQDSCLRDCWATGHCSWSVERRLEAALQCKAWVLCWRSDYTALLTPHSLKHFFFSSLPKKVMGGKFVRE